jgi:hypothetical protein
VNTTAGASSYPYIVIYTKSSLLEQTTPVWLAVSDAISVVSSVSFTDHDLDRDELGHTVTWLEAGDVDLVTYYSVYLAMEDSGWGVSRIGDDVAVRTTHIDIASDTVQVPYRFIVVYTKSSLAEQTTPAYLRISDSVESVSNVAFIDRDLDEGEIGDTVAWTAPLDVTLVTYYSVYLAYSGYGLKRSQLSHDVGVGTNELLIPGDTDLRNFSHIVVYTKSSLVEQTTPVALSIHYNDTERLVSNIAFTDRDLDEHDIGGDLEWSAPIDASLVTHYVVYLAASVSGASRSQVGFEVPVGVNRHHIPVNTTAGASSYPYIVIYTKSSLLEQTTPVWLAVSDAISVISSRV